MRLDRFEMQSGKLIQVPVQLIKHHEAHEIRNSETIKSLTIETRFYEKLMKLMTLKTVGPSVAGG